MSIRENMVYHWSDVKLIDHISDLPLAESFTLQDVCSKFTKTYPKSYVYWSSYSGKKIGEILELMVKKKLLTKTYFSQKRKNGSVTETLYKRND